MVELEASYSTISVVEAAASAADTLRESLLLPWLASRPPPLPQPPP